MIIHADNEFKPLLDKVKNDLDITINYANSADHVSDKEKNNTTFKER